MKRTEVSENLKWDLSTIFENEEKWQEAFNNLQTCLDDMYSYKNTFYKSELEFIEFYKKEVILDNEINRLYTYASLNLDAETTNTTWQKNKAKINNFLAQNSNKLAEVENEINVHVDDILNIVRTAETLNFLEIKYVRIKDNLKHELSEIEKKLLAKVETFSNSQANGFTAINEMDFNVSDVLDKDGNKHVLTHATYSKYLESKDEVLRKNAFETIGKWYQNHRNLYASNLYYNFKKLDEMAKIHKHEDALSASLFEDRSNRKVLNTLFESVSEHHDIERKYHKILQKLLNKDKLERWDLAVNPIDFEKNYTIEEQKEIALTIGAIYKNDYREVISKMFDQRWIDWVPSDAKRSGAYSSGSTTTNKFILLNDNSTLNSLSTLLHEIGHSAHSYYSTQANNYEFAGYTIMEAEIASTLNELFLFDYLLTIAKTNEEKIVYLMNLISSFRGTIIRQSMFARVEVAINDRITRGEFLTADDFENIYETIVKEYFGDSVELNEYWKYEIYRIPHFYYNFYVYKYATGLTSAIAIYNNIKENYDETVDQIFNFFKEGRKKDPLEVIKTAGVDLEQKNTYDLAYKQFNDWVEQLEELIGNQK